MPMPGARAWVLWREQNTNAEAHAAFEFAAREAGILRQNLTADLLSACVDCRVCSLRFLRKVPLNLAQRLEKCFGGAARSEQIWRRFTES